MWKPDSSATGLGSRQTCSSAKSACSFCNGHCPARASVNAVGSPVTLAVTSSTSLLRPSQPATRNWHQKPSPASSAPSPTMAPNQAMASLTRLIQLLLDNERPAENSQPATTALKKRLQAIIFFPPHSEPSARETHQRWARVLERQRIENQGIVAQQLDKRLAELLEISKTADPQLSKNLDSFRAFLLELHSPPSKESYSRAIEFQRAEDAKLQVETQAEIDRKLYHVIMASEPLVGDHWQTDIYAGSSSSLSDSTPSSDWNSDSDDGVPDPASEPELHLSNNFKKNQLPKPEPVQQHPHPETSPALDKLARLKRDAYWLKSEAELASSQLPELIALREVLAALLNLGGGLIYTVPSHPRHPITLSDHLPTLLNKSAASSVSLLSSFLPVLASLRTLRQLALPKDDPPPARKTRTEEAFASAVLGLLQQFDVFLTSIELQLLGLPGAHAASDPSDRQFESVVSLMRLYHRLDQNGWIELFAALANALPDPSTLHAADHPSSSTKALLDNLYRFACHFDAHCKSAAAVQQIKMIFLGTCGPVWTWVGDWIRHGRLPECPAFGEPNRPKTQPNGEFFIGLTSFTGSNTAENWWEDHYVLKEPAIPEFLHDFVASIFEAGKASALSRILDIQSDDPEHSSWPQLEELVPQPQAAPPDSPSIRAAGDPKLTNVLRAHLRHLAFSSSPSPPNGGGGAGSNVSFDLDLYAHISRHLGPLVTQTHSQLYIRFSSPLKLSTYLDALNQFFLLGSQTSVQFLKKTIEDAGESAKSSLLSAHSLLNTTNWWEEQVMEANLSKAFEYAPSPLISSCLPKLKIAPSIRTEPDPLKCLEAIQISLTVPSPLNYVLDNAHVIRTYNRCFVFLGQLARAAWTLDSLIWVKPMLPFGSAAAAKEFERRAEAKEFFRLKNRLAWFVNLISDYSLNLVILNWKSRVLEALDVQIGDLSQTIRLTRRWLARLAGLLFLSEQCQPLNSVILQVLQLCARSHEVWTSFNRQATTAKLIEEINETYVDTERRRRRIERRKRRMKNEQYTLIEEESRHIQLDDALLADADDLAEDERLRRPASAGLLSPAHSPAGASLAWPPALAAGSRQQEEPLEQLQKMNEQFEKLLLALQRAIGKLCRRALRSSAPAPHPPISPEGSPVGVGLEDSQDLDTLSLLECRLDEWIT
ncbi:hypothetical protein PtA15_7A645 [Puccinia triticina]|uniref:Spindle pole body component n=1 Tax=Puccinia triticina TaxID=208348 RepID=A0ABY7CNU0_9BASI|nr:uncharacterized protein PtA15_7A645 [Puccinia triticina]WAQ86916.1 hypothetical protein PtA15_7A645 [Puccinia triticina]